MPAVIIIDVNDNAAVPETVDQDNDSAQAGVIRSDQKGVGIRNME